MTTATDLGGQRDAGPGDDSPRAGCARLLIGKTCMGATFSRGCAVPVGQARLRFMLNPAHTRAQVDHVVDVMARFAG